MSASEAAWAATNCGSSRQCERGAAIQYMLNHHVALGRFLEDGDIPIDNSSVERLHVRAALARKNLFAGADAGGDRVAIVFTIFGSCRLVGVDLLEYLGDVLPGSRDRSGCIDLPDLLPARWKAQRVAAAAATAS